METKEPLFEIAKNNFMNYVSRSKVELNNLVVQLLGSSNAEHFQNIRLKFFMQNKMPMVAFYAQEQEKGENKRSTKIIKITLSFHEFIACVNRVKQDLYKN